MHAVGSAFLRPPPLLLLLSPSQTQRSWFSSICTRRTSFFFDSAKCIIPHPSKKRGGEDAAFCSSRYLGVSDGVSGWITSGVDAGLYSRELLHRMKQVLQEYNMREGVDIPPDPVKVLKEAYLKTRAIGSATCCVVFMDETAKRIRSANLGDSGYFLYRAKDRDIICRSQFQSHSFNFPLQLGTGSSDMPEHADVSECAVKKGDWIVLGTDGLWDNLYDNQVTEILDKATTATGAADALAKTAFQLSNDRLWLSPFSEKERACGRHTGRHNGGKPDDIAVVTAIVKDPWSCNRSEIPDCVAKRIDIDRQREQHRQQVEEQRKHIPK
eukprot:GHVS01095106.1.p2 GENE.GHVS01095106.1~~GHVS01095106.1.p2  ORF type:complete len:341 (+),score=30.33 GHVS01095106.1:47-1024(+)